MKVKNKIILSFFTFYLFFSYPIPLPSSCPITLSQNSIVYASENNENENNKNENEVTVNKDSYKLINDSSKTFNDDDIATMSSNLEKIFENSKQNDSNHQFRLYTFIYNDKNKSVISAEKDIISKYKLNNSINPIIFIYNKSDNSYRFVIDERIKDFVSKDYYQYMVENVLLRNKPITTTNLNEFLSRISSITGVAIKNEMKGASVEKATKEEIKEENFDIRSFDTDASLTSKSSNISNNTDKATDKNTKDDNNSLYFIIPLILAFISIGMIVLKHKQKKNKK